jgi:hypothetical protein
MRTLGQAHLPRITTPTRTRPTTRQPLAARPCCRCALPRRQRGHSLGRVVQTPRRAGDPAPRADASRTVDVEYRRGGRRSLVNGSPVRCGSPFAHPWPFELAGLPGGWRAAIALRMGRATRSKRSSTRRTSPVPLSRRERRARSDTTLSTASYCRATTATDRSAHVASVALVVPLDLRATVCPDGCWTLCLYFTIDE